MTQALTLPVAGLMTDPGPFTAAPDGGFAEAQNVVVLRPGVVEPRPGLQYIADATLKAGDYASDALYADHNDQLWNIAATPPTGTPLAWLIRRHAGNTITGPTRFRRGFVRFKPTGGRALFTSENGVCTLPGQPASPASGSPTVAYRSGMPQPYCPRAFLVTAGVAANWLPVGQSVAYRVTLRRKLANGTIVESAPSGRIVVANTAAGARAVGITDVTGNPPHGWYDGGGSVTGQTYGNLIVGDEMCIYRSPRSTGTPSDEMMLRTVLPWDATLGSFGALDGQGNLGNFVDALDDGAWSGPALYTNASQETIAMANLRPEYARDIALYNGMTFYGGAKTAQRCDLTIKNLFVTAPADASQGLWTFAFTGAISSGSNTITGVSDVNLFSVGQIITLTTQAPGAATPSFPANTYVTAVNTSTNVVTLSANAGATNAAANCVAWDWIETVAPGAPVTPSANRIYYAHPSGAVGTLPARWFNASASAGACTLDNRWNGDLTTAVQLRCAGVTQTTEIACSFFMPDPTSSAFAVRSSKRYAWDAYVDNVVGVTSAQQGSVAELRWSKTNEPESVPIPYRATIGDASYPIRRIVEAKNSLLVFKDDGLFQVYGPTPDDLRFEVLDASLRLPAALDPDADVQSKWCEPLQDRVYAMTTRGPMSIGDEGGLLVGESILETLRREVGATSDDFGGGTNPRALVVDQDYRRVHFVFNEQSGTVSTWYTMDVDTGLWTTWKSSIVISSACVRPRVDPQLLVAGVVQSPFWIGARYTVAGIQRRPNLTGLPVISPFSFWWTSDSWLTETCNVLSVTGAGPYTVTIASGSEWTPEVGDGIPDAGTGTTWCEVIGVTSPTVFTTDNAPALGAQVWLEAYDVRLVWIARAEGNVGSEKHWLSLVFPMELARIVQKLRYYVGGYRNTNAPAEGNVFADPAMPPGPWPLTAAFARVAVPTSHARDWAIRVGWTLRQCGAWFSTAGLSVLFTPVSPDKAAR